jgi:hypothetical protein
MPGVAAQGAKTKRRLRNKMGRQHLREVWNKDGQVGKDADRPIERCGSRILKYAVQILFKSRIRHEEHIIVVDVASCCPVVMGYLPELLDFTNVIAYSSFKAGRH